MITIPLQELLKDFTEMEQLFIDPPREELRYWSSYFKTIADIILILQ